MSSNTISIRKNGAIIMMFIASSSVILFAFFCFALLLSHAGHSLAASGVLLLGSFLSLIGGMLISISKWPYKYLENHR